MDNTEYQVDTGPQDRGDLAGHASVRDVVAILFIHKWVILTAFIILLAAIYWGLSLRQELFVSSVDYYVDRTYNQQMGITYTPGMDYEEEMNSIAELGRSQAVLMSFARSYDQARGWENPPKERSTEVAGALAEYIEVSPVPETNMIEIRVRDADPDTALMIADLYSRAFHEEYKRVHRPEFSRDFVQRNIEMIEDRIREASREKAALESDAMLLDLRAMETRVAENKAIFERQLTDMRIASESLENQLRRDRILLDEAAGGTVPSIELRGDPLVERYEVRLADLEMFLAELESRYTPDHPLVLAKREEIAEIRRQREEAIRLSIRTRQEKLDRMRETESILVDAIAEIEQRLRSIPGPSGDIAYYQEFLNMQWNLYARLITQFNDKLVDEEFTILDNKLAKLGEPVISDIEGLTPSVVYALVAPIFALVLAISTAFMVEATSQNFQKPAELESYTGLPVFATFRKL